MPCPNMKPNAWMTAMKPNTTPTAPLALVPRLLTKAVSTRLYTLVIIIETMAGMASFNTSLDTGSPVMRS